MDFESNVVKSRLTEPSTYAGISAFLAALASLPVPALQPWFVAGSGIFGSLAVLLRETGNKS